MGLNIFKVLKKKLIITLIAVSTTIIGIGISTKILFRFHNSNTTTEKMQDSSIKGTNTIYVSTDAQNIQKNNNKEPNSIVDSENSSNNDTNNKEIASSQLEKTNNNYESNQKNINSQQKNSSNYSEINNQEIINIQTESVNNLNNTNNQQVASTQAKSENIKTIITSKPKSENINNTTLEPKISAIHYDRTTSIYDDDKITLLRVEYYLNNKLTYYSVIEKFDVTTKSYIEKIYKCNLETNIDPLVRTDEYVNGNLTKSY